MSHSVKCLVYKRSKNDNLYKNTFADRKDVFLENVRIHNKVVIVGFKIVNF